MRKWFLVAFALTCFFAVEGQAATIKNTDQKTESLVVAEGSSRRDVSLKADQTVDICPKGCFVTFPNGDRFAIKATDTIEINGSRASFK
ncbi:hypothetical protein [uncultured Bartonella sp.]|uniref:hypothetical protein n=1 Tax=uncultured Bartonella sp. TaxID=104108 RepID=UPI0025E6DFFF|nr:hypothetical protein [uncultured Bartonella sp.]